MNVTEFLYPAFCRNFQFHCRDPRLGRPQHSIKLPMNASLIRSQTAFTPSPTDDICKSVCKISLADSSGRALIISQVCFAKIAFTKSVESFESGKSKSRLFSPLLSPERAKKPDLRLKMSSWRCSSEQFDANSKTWNFERRENARVVWPLFRRSMTFIGQKYRDRNWPKYGHFWLEIEYFWHFPIEYIWTKSGESVCGKKCGAKIEARDGKRIQVSKCWNDADWLQKTRANFSTNPIAIRAHGENDVTDGVTDPTKA